MRRWFGLEERCPSCGLSTDRGDGSWVGALGLNTIASFSLLFFGLLAAFLAWWPEAPPLWLSGAAVGVALVVPVLALPFSRLVWLAVELALRPPGDRPETGAGSNGPRNGTADDD